MNQRTDIDSSEPLLSARRRGNEYVEAEYSKPENLTPDAVNALTGIPVRMLHQKRMQGFLYALLPLENQLECRYPRWQFEADPKRLAAVLFPFFAADINTWVVHDFMMRAHEALAGMRACDYILDSSNPIGTVVLLAEQSLPREQGAS